MRRIWLTLGALVLAACASVDPARIREGETHRDLGTVYLNRGEVEMAIREYRAALDAWELDPETHFALGEAYRRKAELVAAEQHLRRALALDPQKQDARLNLGVIYLQQERWADAITENRILVDDPTFLMPARALVNLGWAQYKSGDFEGAKRSLRSALAVDPSSYHAHVNMAILLYDEGGLVQAVQHFEWAAEALGERPAELFGLAEAEVRFRMAMAHVRLGQRDRALENLRIAADRGGETEWGRKSRDYIEVLR
jgi:Tfp pilus assembly protein PilF